MHARYEGPLEPGMVMWAPDNDGEPFRRDLLLAKHPFKPDLWIYEALPCPMRKAVGSDIGRIGLCPELNIRIVMRPEEGERASG